MTIRCRKGDSYEKNKIWGTVYYILLGSAPVLLALFLFLPARKIGELDYSTFTLRSVPYFMVTLLILLCFALLAVLAWFASRYTRTLAYKIIAITWVAVAALFVLLQVSSNFFHIGALYPLYKAETLVCFNTFAPYYSFFYAVVLGFYGMLGLLPIFGTPPKKNAGRVARAIQNGLTICQPVLYRK